MLKRRIAAEFSQIPVGANENLLRDVFQLAVIPGKARAHRKNPAFVPAHQLGKAVIISVENGVDERFIVRRAGFHAWLLAFTDPLRETVDPGIDGRIHAGFKILQLLQLRGREHGANTGKCPGPLHRQIGPDAR